MWARVIGIGLTMAIIGYLFYALNGSNKAVQKALDTNPTVQEQKQTLRGAGVNPDDPEALKKYTTDQAKQIEEYQHSADGLEKP